MDDTTLRRLLADGNVPRDLLTPEFVRKCVALACTTPEYDDVMGFIMSSSLVDVLHELTDEAHFEAVFRWLGGPEALVTIMEDRMWTADMTPLVADRAVSYLARTAKGNTFCVRRLLCSAARSSLSVLFKAVTRHGYHMPVAELRVADVTGDNDDGKFDVERIGNGAALKWLHDSVGLPLAALLPICDAEVMAGPALRICGARGQMALLLSHCHVMSATSLRAAVRAGLAPTHVHLYRWLRNSVVAPSRFAWGGVMEQNEAFLRCAALCETIRAERLPLDGNAIVSRMWADTPRAALLCGVLLSFGFISAAAVPPALQRRMRRTTACHYVLFAPQTFPYVGPAMRARVRYALLVLRRACPALPHDLRVLIVSRVMAAELRAAIDATLSRQQRAERYGTPTSDDPAESDAVVMASIKGVVPYRRARPNRHGHSAAFVSFAHLGYASLCEMAACVSPAALTAYLRAHCYGAARCCRPCSREDAYRIAGYLQDDSLRSALYDGVAHLC